MSEETSERSSGYELQRESTWTATAHVCDLSRKSPDQIDG
jgi:hypothetical protein